MKQLVLRGLLALSLSCSLPSIGFSNSGSGNSQDAPKEVNSPPHPVPDLKGLKVLFSGKESEVAENWVRNGALETAAAWAVKDGAMLSSGYDIVSKEKFTDFQLHVEFREPYMPDAKGQGRGNSGVFMQGRYEVQVLDSYGIADPGKGDCGAVYNQAAPLVNACKPPLQWQSYDITFRAPRCDETGKVVEKARISVLHNGISVQNNTEINGPTWGGWDNKVATPGPIILQFHHNPVQFRNVWIVPLPLKGVDHY